jgi:hypothetical protein
MDAKCSVFTYWEGDPYPFTQLCVESIHRVFGDRHVHLTPESLDQWLVLPSALKDSRHFSFRSDFIRTFLLKTHGGWWFDADVLLFRDPSALVETSRPQIWTLIYRVAERWEALVNNGILYSPAESPWICAVARDFLAVDVTRLGAVTRANEDVGQDIYERHSVGADAPVRVGGPHDFNSTSNVDADFAPFWDGRIELESAQYGLHLGASLSRWAEQDGVESARNTLRSGSLETLLGEFPHSVVSQYVTRFAQDLPASR